MNRQLIQIENLTTLFSKRKKDFAAVSGVSFTVNESQIMSLVGESGSGKSVTALSIMRLITPPGRIARGSIFYNGNDLLTLPEETMRRVRGNDISMIFQEPLVSLNPVLTIGQQITEVIRLHQQAKKKQSRQVAMSMLEQVGFPNPAGMLNRYPFELSGGLRQRAMIAMALCCQPALLIADEPTTALDVTIQRQILELIKSLRDRFHMAVILITHDLGVVAETAEKVAVMYAGEIVEMSDVRTIFKNPLHPYTIALHRCIPQLTGPRGDLFYITGTVPNLDNVIRGCPFVDRCETPVDECRERRPPFVEVSTGHHVKCWKIIN